MGEQMKKVISGVVIAVVFIICMALVVVGQRNVGPQGLVIMLIGLAGLIFLLWLYNRHYR